MFKCRACVTRCIRAIAAESSTLTAKGTPLILTPRLSVLPQRRHQSTAVATSAAAPETDALSVLEKGGRNAIRNVKGRSRSNDALANKEKHLRTELTYLKDPVKFAQHVHYVLRQNDPDKALDLCRLASKSMNCVVAWNHVINWMMTAKRANEAIKIYNEMKKRGQFPDSYTYMQLLSGFSNGFSKIGREKPDVLEQNVAKAVAIYTSMSAPSSRVKPNIMHTNATLRVCSLARDMDALWTVASKIPEHGSGAADHKTYSILLGAIRYGAFGKGAQHHEENVSVERLLQLRQQAVNEGRRIWQEVVEKWRGGSVMIDESLVVEMANLLVFGRRMQDWDDVLNLVRQTTNIDRLIPPLGSPERQSSHVPLAEIDRLTPEVEDEEGWVPTPASNAFKAVSPHKHDSDNAKRPTRLTYVRPGNGILNVLLQACTHMRTPKTAYAYWEKLTKEYDVTPDRNNFKEILRLLQINRASNRAVELLKLMHSDRGVAPHFTTYRMVTAVLARDWKNPHVLDTAMSMMDDMERYLDFPDVEVLRSILSLVQLTNSRESVPSEKSLKVLLRVRDAIHALPSGADTSGDTLSLLNNMVGVVAICSTRKDIPQGEVEQLQSLRSTLNSYITQSMKDRLSWRNALNSADVAKGNKSAGYQAKQSQVAEKIWRVSTNLLGSETGPRIRAHISRS